MAKSANELLMYKDFLGRPISVGNEVAYPGRQGSSLWMNYGIVEELGTREHWSGTQIPTLKVRRIPLNAYEKERTVWIEHLKSRVVVVG